jgi:hypothetical protein
MARLVEDTMDFAGRMTSTEWVETSEKCEQAGDIGELRKRRHEEMMESKTEATREETTA